MATNQRTFNPYSTTVPAKNPTANEGLQKNFKEIGYRQGESPTETFEFGTGGTAKRRIKLVTTDLWDEIYNGTDPTDAQRGAISQILGYAAHQGAGVKLRRWQPELHPIYPFMVAKRVSLQGLGSNASQTRGRTPYADWSDLNILGAKINSYPETIVDIEYETPLYPILFDADISSEIERFVSVEPKPNGDYLSLPTGGMKWAGGAAPPAGQLGLPYPAQTGIIIPTIDYMVTWHQVPASAIPLNAFMLAIGRVNKTNLSLLIKNATRAFTPHQLLLTSIEATKALTPYGQWYYDIKYTMKYFEQQHNKFLQFFNNTKNFYRISIDGTDYGTGAVADGKYVFDEYDFNNLFKVE